MPATWIFLGASPDRGSARSRTPHTKAKRPPARRASKAETISPFFRDRIDHYLDEVQNLPEGSPALPDAVHNLAAHVLMCLDVDADAKHRLVSNAATHDLRQVMREELLGRSSAR